MSKQRIVQVKVKGQTFPSLAACASHYGLTYAMLYQRVKIKGMPIEEAVAMPRQRQRGDAAKATEQPAAPKTLDANLLRLPARWLFLSWDTDGFFLWTGEPTLVESKQVFRTLEHSCAPCGDVFELDHLIPADQSPILYPINR